MASTNLLEAIRVVKENEWTASEFYSEAAQKTGSEVGRKLFSQLREFELYHYARIGALEKSLQEKDSFISYEGREFPLPPVITPKEAEEPQPQHQTIIDIILKAMELEKEAEKAYADLAEDIVDRQGHAMFSRLSGEEHNHYRILKEAYWNLSNFRAWEWAS